MTLRSNLLGILAAALAVAGCGEPAAPRRSVANVLLVTVDTLRADHLSAWGYARPTSPVIDRLAAEGVRFDQAWAQWPKTGPSFASLFTATYPKDNGIVRRIGTPLPAGFLMLAEGLKRRGYATHAVVSNSAVGREFYFDQGFDTYVETWKLPPEPDGSANTAAVVNREVLATVAAMDRSRPFFLWVHYIDPHFPYRPPAEWLAPFLADGVYEPLAVLDVAGTPHRQMGGIGKNQLLDRRRDLGYYVAAYDAEIAYADHHIGRLLDELGSAGLMDNTLTVLTSDHGESLGDHNYYFDHGRFGFESCLHVPLVFYFPGRIEPRVDREPVELLSLAPTILQFAGVSLPDGAWMQARSLLPRLAGEAGDDEDGFSHAEAGYATEGRWQKIVRDQRYKLIFAPYSASQRYIGGRGRPYALYDLEADPGETVNLAESEPEIFARLKDELYAWWIRGSFDAEIDVDDVREEVEVSAETIEQLKALGYLQ
ncbi:MAG: sulfatase-like hydrolase/transferase [Acidobacteriota bacterium]|nr:sulfatase-like hydrolase/transferase [Acidobacteriota bacterium]MDH3524496.1 sulfatase-like hydrolase/transferase [Acidobacteriota bacterium]